MNLPTPFARREQKRSQTSLRGSNASVDHSGSKKSCINLEELMQFEAARQRALFQIDPGVIENPFSEFVPNRIFINHIDTFNGSHLARHLSKIMWTSKEELGEGDYEDSRQDKLLDDIDTDDYEEQIQRTEDENMEMSQRDSVGAYEIVGSLEFYNNPNYKRPPGIFELLDNEKRSEFLEKLLTCGFIIYDITSDVYCHPKQVEEAKWVLECINKRLELFEKNKNLINTQYNHCRVFILISTLSTWAKTKPIDPEDPTLPFTERDFRKRRPHPNYKIHCEFEKKVTELGKKFPQHLKTIIIGSGVTYGYEEDILHYLFKMAWQDAPFLPLFKPGNNIIPVIHIDSLASVVQTVIQNFPSKYRYIIATDPHSVTLKEITKLLAKQLGNGKTKVLDKEEAFLFPDIKQRNYDMLTSSVNIVPGYILDNPLIKWGTDRPFTENISYLINQFKTARGLAAVKIFIHGPPASGKSFMASRLCAYYDVPYLREAELVNETINNLKQRIEEKTKRETEKAEHEDVQIEGDEAAEDDDKKSEDEEEEDLETLKQKLRDIEENMEKNGNKLDEEYLLRIFKEKLSSNACKNKGYVIDGYPENMEQTKILYAPTGDEEVQEGEDAEEEQGGDISRICNVNILPAYVESLDASDEYLMNRVIKLPEINLTQFEEHEMCRRLTEFRALNTEDNTPLIFYDEMEVHPMIYNIENDHDVQMKPTFEAIINHIGPPRNYAPEIPSLDAIFNQEEENKLKMLENLKTQKDEVKKAADDRRQNFEKWMLLKNQELEMEERALLLMGMPLRHYLMKYIFPCLTRGLVEVARLRPEDPVDFLSEFLFRENPEGKMFQPNYDEREEILARAVKEYETREHSTASRSSKKSFSTEKSVKSDVISRVTDYKCSFVTSSSSKKSGRSKLSSSLGSSRIDKDGKSETSSMGVCTCQKSPSLSTCSSDRTPSTGSSCTCAAPEPCEPCEPCTPEDEKEEDPCKCPCEK